MKKIIAFMLCLMLILAVPVFATTGSEAEMSTTEVIVEWVKSHIEEISVIGTLLLTIFYEIRKHGKLNGSIGTLNNNAVKIAEDSSATIKQALDEVKDIADVVNKYKEEFATLIEEIRKSAEEKLTLEETLSHVENFLKTSKLATIELSNEVAELLVLANIPNSKKDELYARHMKAVHEIEAAEEVVTSYDNKEA
ncbi:MAG: hypothetical protein IJX51_08795 [Clostridia bacterium]|nr:hypothetical protein [Clostridia bacterium]